MKHFAKNAKNHSGAGNVVGGSGSGGGACTAQQCSPAGCSHWTWRHFAQKWSLKSTLGFSGPTIPEEPSVRPLLLVVFPLLVFQNAQRSIFEAGMLSGQLTARALHSKFLLAPRRSINTRAGGPNGGTVAKCKLPPTFGAFCKLEPTKYI